MRSPYKSIQENDRADQRSVKNLLQAELGKEAFMLSRGSKLGPKHHWWPVVTGLQLRLLDTTDKNPLYTLRDTFVSLNWVKRVCSHGPTALTDVVLCARMWLLAVQVQYSIPENSRAMLSEDETFGALQS